MYAYVLRAYSHYRAARAQIKIRRELDFRTHTNGQRKWKVHKLFLIKSRNIMITSSGMQYMEFALPSEIIVYVGVQELSTRCRSRES